MNHLRVALSRWSALTPTGWFFLLSAWVVPHAFALNPDEKPANYIAGHWDTENGLPHNSVKQLFQTRNGYLWIGTQQGLARFDGLTLTTFTSHNTPAIPNNQITSMAETADDSLWIGTSAGLVRYRDGEFTSFNRTHGIKSDTINAVAVAPDGSLWIAGRNGVTRWADGRFVNDIDTSAFNTLAMRTMIVDRQKNIWLVSGNEVLRYRDGTFVRFDRAQGLPAQGIQMMREDAAGHLVVVTQSGLRRLEGETFVPFEQNAALSSPRLSTALFDRSGNLWTGSVGGLDRWHDGQVVAYIDRNGHKLGVVDALIEGREGCLWVGTSEGLYRLTDRRASSLSTEAGLPGSLATAVMQSRDGSLWVSTWGAGVTQFQNGTATRYEVGKPLSHETVTAIYESPDGAMWFGNRGSSVDRLVDGKVSTYVYQLGVATSRPVTAMLADDDGTLLIGISKRGLLQLRDAKISPVPEAAALAAATVWKLFRTRDGRLLMGTSEGIFQRRADRTWEPVKFPGLDNTVVARDLLEADDTLWLATDGHGLVRWQGGHARAYTSREGLVDDTLFSVLDDGHGALWVSSARGLARVRQSELTALDRGTATVIDCLTLGRVDGLLSASTAGDGSPAAWRLTDGRIMTTTDKGVAVVDPRLLQVNSQPPTVVIETVLADDRALPTGRDLTVPAGVGKLEFRYTALSLIAPERQRFRYQLEGSDTRWVEAGHDRRAHYTHLAPGRYTFRVLACNNDGVWNETGATLAVTMLPHFYQTFWFRLAAITLLVALGTSLVWLRIRRLKEHEASLRRMNAELDQRVRERTAELSRSNDEVQQRELLFRLIFEHAPVGISWRRVDLGTNYHFNSTFRRILGLPSATLPDASLLTGMIHCEDAPRGVALVQLIDAGLKDSYSVEQRYVRQDGVVVWGMLSVAVVRDAAGRVIQEIGILEDVTARKKAEQELAETYKNLVEVSRTAGMAEVATGVLHNVGNVLNSLNVSATVIAAGLRQSKADSLAKLSTLLGSHAADLGDFLTRDPKGRRVPEFIASLSQHFLEERERLQRETHSLQENVDHIKEIVSMQQAYATTVSAVEAHDPVALMEDSVRMNAGALVRHDVRVVRDFQPVRPVLAEKSKVLQILINVIRNAKYACDDAGRPDKVITLRIAPGDADHVRLIVSDNGIGIPAENLTRIFGHGFTTRANGHGFGLHSAANAAKEMKGSLTVHSDGPGRGATFTLELPATPAPASAPSEEVSAHPPAEHAEAPAEVLASV